MNIDELIEHHKTGALTYASNAREAAHTADAWLRKADAARDTLSALVELKERGARPGNDPKTSKPKPSKLTPQVGAAPRLPSIEQTALSACEGLQLENGAITPETFAGARGCSIERSQDVLSALFRKGTLYAVPGSSEDARAYGLAQGVGGGAPGRPVDFEPLGAELVAEYRLGDAHARAAARSRAASMGASMRRAGKAWHHGVMVEAATHYLMGAYPSLSLPRDAIEARFEGLALAAICRKLADADLRCHVAAEEA